MSVGGWITAAVALVSAAGLVSTALQHRQQWARDLYRSVYGAMRWWMVPAALAQMVCDRDDLGAAVEGSAAAMVLVAADFGV